MASGRADKGFCRKKSKGEIKRRKRAKKMYLAITAIKKNPPNMMCSSYLSIDFAFTIFAKCSYLFTSGANLGEATPCIHNGSNTFQSRELLSSTYFL